MSLNISIEELLDGMNFSDDIIHSNQVPLSPILQREEPEETFELFDQSTTSFYQADNGDFEISCLFGQNPETISRSRSLNNVPQRRSSPGLNRSRSLTNTPFQQSLLFSKHDFPSQAPTGPLEEPFPHLDIANFVSSHNQMDTSMDDIDSPHSLIPNSINGALVFAPHVTQPPRILDSLALHETVHTSFDVINTKSHTSISIPQPTRSDTIVIGQSQNFTPFAAHKSYISRNNTPDIIQDLCDLEFSNTSSTSSPLTFSPSCSPSFQKTTNYIPPDDCPFIKPPLTRSASSDLSYRHLKRNSSFSPQIPAKHPTLSRSKSRCDD